MKELLNNKKFCLAAKIILTLLTLGASVFIGAFGFLVLYFSDLNDLISYPIWVITPIICLPLIWWKGKRKLWLIVSLIIVLIYGGIIGANLAYLEYEESITIDTSPNIRYSDYLPFEYDSKIFKLKNSSLKLNGNLPILDGADAVVPVYSAFIHATYPDDTTWRDDSLVDVFETNNTVSGYRKLARKQTDIFFGAYPSQEQRDYAIEQGTEFVYVPIGSEAFVFFVHKDNPIEELTSEEIRKIYSGEITNWKEVGGRNEPIDAYQRNEGSGSQSMLIRFMGDTPIMEPPVDMRNDFMGGIIDDVADYKNRDSSIGFSFRYYVEGIIQNPDIKLISIDGVAPTIENIKNGTYPIVTPLYAVTYAGNKNENVKILLDWILSDEGQKIIEETGYAGIKEKVEVDIPEISRYDYQTFFYYNDFSLLIPKDNWVYSIVDDTPISDEYDVIANVYHIAEYKGNSTVPMDNGGWMFSILRTTPEKLEKLSLNGVIKEVTYYSADKQYVYVELRPEKGTYDYKHDSEFSGNFENVMKYIRVDYNSELKKFE